MALRMQGSWRSAEGAEGKAVLYEDREDSMAREGGSTRLADICKEAS